MQNPDPPVTVRTPSDHSGFDTGKRSYGWGGENE